MSQARTICGREWRTSSPDVAVAGERARRALFLGHQKIFSISGGRSAWIPATSSSMRSKV